MIIGSPIWLAPFCEICTSEGKVMGEIGDEPALNRKPPERGNCASGRRV